MSRLPRLKQICSALQDEYRAVFSAVGKNLGAKKYKSAQAVEKPHRPGTMYSCGFRAVLQKSAKT
jgi:hypothetical protein